MSEDHDRMPVCRRRFLKTVAGAAGFGALASLSFARGRDSATPWPGFKYAICNEMLASWPLPKALDFMAECGYAGVEIAPSTLARQVGEVSAVRRTEIRRQAERAHLTIVGLHCLLMNTTGLHLTSPDAGVRRRTSAYLVDLGRFCADLGGKVMVLGSPAQRNLPPAVTRAQGTRYAVDVLSRAMPSLEKYGVTLAIEPLGPSETDFIRTAAEGKALMDLVDSPSCRLHLDCKAMATEATPIPEIIRKFRRDFVHFHANDVNRQGPGFGKMDFKPILKTLREVDYRGWVSVEPLDFPAGPERVARESIHYLRQCEPSV